MADGEGIGPMDVAVVELPTEAFTDSAREVTPVLLQPKTPTLPLDQVASDVFESLMLRVARESLGLRKTKIYGVAGQAQFGIDIVGEDPSGRRVCVQCKRYEKYGVSDLTAAVAKYDEGGLPFEVAKLIIAVAAATDRTELVDEQIRLDKAHPDLSIELWGQREISEELRRRPDIVAEFFGEEAARLFCLDVPRQEVVPAVTHERADLAMAAMQGPLASTGAGKYVDAATAKEPDDPAGAAKDLKRAQDRLLKSGFRSQAETLTERRAQLLGRAGATDEGVLVLSDLVWTFIRNHELDFARSVASGIDKLIAADAAPSPSSKARQAIVHSALQVESDPAYGVSDDASAALSAELAPFETAQLAVLLSLHSATTPGDRWRHDNVPTLASLAAQFAKPKTREERQLALALQIEVADATGDWAILVSLARKRQLPRSDAALIFARHAQSLSYAQDFESADAEWSEAIEQAILAGTPDRAADWVYAQRLLVSRLGPDPFGPNDFHRLAQSLRSSSPSTKPPSRLLERGVKAVLDGKLLEASLLLRRGVRAARADGEWGLEAEFRGYLAQAYERSGEPLWALQQLILAGMPKPALATAKSAGDKYLDAFEFAAEGPYWARAAAFQALSEQGDLVPDDQVRALAQVAIDVLESDRAGNLIDSRYFTPQLRQEARRFLASIGTRVTTKQAAWLLAHYRPLIKREQNHYRFTDDFHVDTCVAIAHSQPGLRSRALNQLLELLQQDVGVAQRVEQKAMNLFRDFDDEVGKKLEKMAASGNRYAVSILAFVREKLPTDLTTQAGEAAKALRSKPGSRKGVWTIGTGAVDQSLLAAHLDAVTRKGLIREQIRRVNAPDEPTTNRVDYLIAASNLTASIDDSKLFKAALEIARNGGPSQADFDRGLSNHPLSSFRFDDDSDVRPPALLLAAALARTTEQMTAVVGLAVSTASVNRGADRIVAQALLQIGTKNLSADVALLATQERRSLRAIAALAWAGTRRPNESIGLALAKDADQVVRRTLATAIGPNPMKKIPKSVVAALRSDVRYSIRSALSA